MREQKHGNQAKGQKGVTFTLEWRIVIPVCHFRVNLCNPAYFHLNAFNKLFLAMPLGGLLTVILYLQFVLSAAK